MRRNKSAHSRIIDVFLFPAPLTSGHFRYILAAATTDSTGCYHGRSCVIGFSWAALMMFEYHFWDSHSRA